MSVLSRLEQDRQRPGVSCPRCFGSRLLIVQGRDIAQATFCPECTKTCETCGGSGTVFDRNELGSVDASPCPDCSPLRAQIQLYNKAQIPRRYHDATFGDFEWQHDASLHEAYMRLSALAKELQPGDKGWALSGQVGSGKTYLMTAMLRELLLKRQIPSRFIEFSHLLSTIRAGYDSGQSEADVISHLVEIPVLVIDELGKSLKTDWQIAILDELISRRYNRAVTTFFTTNFAFSGNRGALATSDRDDFKRVNLEERIGGRMYSRLCEMCHLYTLTAGDYRRRQVSG